MTTLTDTLAAQVLPLSKAPPAIRAAVEALRQTPGRGDLAAVSECHRHGYRYDGELHHDGAAELASQWRDKIAGRHVIANAQTYEKRCQDYERRVANRMRAIADEEERQRVARLEKQARKEVPFDSPEAMAAAEGIVTQAAE